MPCPLGKPFENRFYKSSWETHQNFSRFLRLLLLMTIFFDGILLVNMAHERFFSITFSRLQLTVQSMFESSLLPNVPSLSSRVSFVSQTPPDSLNLIFICHAAISISISIKFNVWKQAQRRLRDIPAIASPILTHYKDNIIHEVVETHISSCTSK